MIDAIRQARNKGDLTLAHSLIHKAVQANGGVVSGQVGYEYGLFLMQALRHGEARDVFNLLAANHPDDSTSRYHIGQCSEIMGEYYVAEFAFRECLKAHKIKRGQPHQAAAYFSLGANLFRLGRNTEAEDAWRKGLRGECNTPEGFFMRSQVRLCLGEYDGGWGDYEARRTMPGWVEGVKSRIGDTVLPPEWDGKSEGRVLVYGDQGAGDVIQFSRYLPHVAHRSSRAVHVEAGEPLRTLIGVTDALSCDWSAPICSLPFLLGMSEPVAPRATWAKPSNPKPRVGVCWKGTDKHFNDRDRSSPIDFRGVLRDYRWEIVSLQYGVDFSPKDYAETAELMRTLDAVVTVDTSTAHVAGTLGIPTLLIPPTSPEWRWGLPKETRTPWYPSVEIIRRKNVADWKGALAQAKQRLVEML